MEHTYEHTTYFSTDSLDCEQHSQSAPVFKLNEQDSALIDIHIDTVDRRDYCDWKYCDMRQPLKIKRRVLCTICSLLSKYSKEVNRLPENHATSWDIADYEQWLTNRTRKSYVMYKYWRELYYKDNPSKLRAGTKEHDSKCELTEGKKKECIARIIERENRKQMKKKVKQ